jgi:hypothetical protein
MGVQRISSSYCSVCSSTNGNNAKRASQKKWYEKMGQMKKWYQLQSNQVKWYQYRLMDQNGSFYIEA